MSHLLESVEGQRAGRLLEYRTLLEDVATHCSLGRSVQQVEQSLPINSTAQLSALWAQVAELLDCLQRGRELPLPNMIDLEELIGDERSITGPMDGSELAAVAAAAGGLASLVDFLAEHSADLPLASDLFFGMASPRPLEQGLTACLEADGRIRDSASPALASLRRAVDRQEQSWRDTARKSLARANRQEWAASSELVLRGDRFCIAVKASDRRKLGGIVHDRSASGQTYFVEPPEVVESGNELAEARMAVIREEQKILIRLNRMVAELTPSLLAIFRAAVQLDIHLARARWARKHQARIPRLNPPSRGELRLPGFRHPLLMSSLRRQGREDELVALDLEIHSTDRVLMISGPNAGGKTVAMKSLGLAVLMAQSGIPLPTAETAVMPIFDQVFLDLGDDQSIADDLSSFSAHLTHLQRILSELSADSLVLLDEIGGGTDPMEGVALARAVLEFLAESGCLALVTTHYGQLKVLVEERKGFRNAGMAYDQQLLRPLFQLRLDAPGASHALEIARRLRLPDSILHRAESLVGDSSLKLDRLILKMEEEREKLASFRRESSQLRDELKKEKRDYQDRTAELKQLRREKLDEAENEAEGIVRNARSRIESLLRRIREAGGSEAAGEMAEIAREEVDRTAEKLHHSRSRRRTPQRGYRPARLESGERVLHLGMKQVGIIREIRGGKILMEIAGRRVQVDADQLVDPSGDYKELPTPGADEGTIRTLDVDTSVSEIISGVDVRGMDGEDAWGCVDKALDRCLLSGVETLEIIHGKGSGRLRTVLSQRLRKDPRVRQASVGGGGRYDDGVTVVTI